MTEQLIFNDKGGFISHLSFQFPGRAARENASFTLRDVNRAVSEIICRTQENLQMLKNSFLGVKLYKPFRCLIKRASKRYD